ncbi:MAG: hypothetical protein ACJASI_000002 [Glaciecola sp.]|jgi:hypothetical protein
MIPSNNEFDAGRAKIFSLYDYKLVFADFLFVTIPQTCPIKSIRAQNRGVRPASKHAYKKQAAVLCNR